jgi:hypothetical protein
LAAVGVLAVLLTTLSGCGTETPVAIPTQQPTSTPIFASDEEALAAAQEAYAAYVVISDDIFADGGTGVDRLKAVVTSDQYEKEIVEYREVEDGGLHTSGRTKLDRVSLQNYDVSAMDGVKLVSLYACLDLSDVRVLNSRNEDVTPPDRDDRLPFETGFDFVEGHLLMAGGQPWSGKDFC